MKNIYITLFLNKKDFLENKVILGLITSPLHFFNIFIIILFIDLCIAYVENRCKN